ncbi:hypothetical protein A2U01_0110521, partial [Trifolium medium]|nr:hypothetical protein [Trifolium medium]
EYNVWSSERTWEAKEAYKGGNRAGG